MTYQKLYEGCYTSAGREAADAMRFLHGFQTEAQPHDVEWVNEIDTKAMGGAE